jgi:glycine/D-amino acid oxidase-like deaminating enzyme/nitrite reductase/ring-hydroxylating ferredoxin subunit
VWKEKQIGMSFPQLIGELEVEVTIVGGGITGLTAAIELVKAGHSVALIEGRQIGSGTTGLSSCHLTTDIDEEYRNVADSFGMETSMLVANSRISAIDYIERTVKEKNIACDFRRVPGYLYTEIPEDVSTLQEEFDAARNAGLMVQLSDSLPLPFKVNKVLRFENQAEFNAQQYVDGLSLNLHLIGGFVFENSVVVSMNEKEGHYIVKTSGGTVRSKYVFVATHQPLFFNVLQTVSAPYISYMIAAKLRSQEFPVGLFWDTADPYHYTRYYQTDKGAYVVVGGEDHKTGHEKNTKSRIERLQQYVKSRFDIASIDYTWSAQYYEPADGLPYIGRSPFGKNIFVATGYSGDGLVYGTVAGLIIADLIQDKRNLWHKVYDSTRFTPAASVADFVKENVNVVKHFIKDRIGVDADGLTDVKPGEGKIVKVNGEKLAVVREDDETLHAVSPVCPHMKCFVSYNNFENTWDCPCHGSRFNADGSVIYGPATIGLHKVEMEIKERVEENDKDQEEKENQSS